MRSRLLRSGLVLLALLALLATLVPVKAEPTEILLKPVDSGYITHIEHVPRPKYTHKELTCVEVARELILLAVYGRPLSEDLLGFVQRCYRGGYFSRTPASTEPDMESTFYALWLGRLIGANWRANETLLADYVCDCRARDFRDAYYALRSLRLLGGNDTLRDCLAGYDLGYAASWLPNSKAPSIEATRLWLLVEWDPRKAEWLARQGVRVPPPDARPEEYARLDYSDWYYIELLLLRRPVFVNATVWPRVVVEKEPRPVRVSAVRWPGEPLDYSFSWSPVNGTIVSAVTAGGRTLEFRHTLARKEYALVRIEQRPGRLMISASYRPPYILTLWIAGKRYAWSSDSYDLEATLSFPAYGSLKVRAELRRGDVVLRGEAELYLETAPERSLLDLAFLALPLAAVAPSLVASRKRRRLGLSIVLLVAPIPLSWHLLLELHPLWVTALYGAAVMAAVWYADREAFHRALGHVAVVLALAAASMVLGNPVILLLGGFGATIFLAAAVLYSSELSKTERFYKSTMLLYSLGVLAMGLLSETAASIASYMWVPDSGFVDAVRTQAMFAANLFALTPVIAPIYHLARLVHAYERAKEAREILERIMPLT